MKMPSNAEAFELLCLLAADDGRGPVLFGDSLDRMQEALPPFMVGNLFPNVYLESPLAGDPFLDVNVGYGELDANGHVQSAYAAGTEEALAWYARARRDYPDISCGYMLDTNKLDLVAAGIYFQPREHHELAVPFCQALGEPERAPLFLDAAARMPRGWPLSYLGMFRGRAEFPLRVGGYLNRGIIDASPDKPRYLVEAFDRIGFTAYDDAMLDQISEFVQATQGTMDFQFDVHPDGTIGTVFSIEAEFEAELAENVRASFENGAGAQIMHLLERWGAADERWKRSIEATLTRTIPVETADGALGRCAFMIMPRWVKVRWQDAKLQPAKLYHLICAGLVD